MDFQLLISSYASVFTSLQVILMTMIGAFGGILLGAIPGMTATMGVEVLRAKFSNDSVWIVNRLEKTYLAEPLDSAAVQLGMPLSLPLLQTLLLDNNEGLPPVENQTVQLKTFVMGNLSAKMRYKSIKLNEETTFPLKITDKMERVRIKANNGQ